MADRGSSGGSGCNDRCGCPSPCPGGQGCRCTSSGGGESGMQHTYCTCGSHCGCNPCTCEKSQDRARAAGKAHCKCGEGCTCATCAS